MDVWMHACMHVHVYIYILFVCREREKEKRERERRKREREKEKREREKEKRERAREPENHQFPAACSRSHSEWLACRSQRAGWGEPVGGRIFAVNAMVEEGATLPEVGKKFNYFGSGIHPSYPFIRSGIIFGVGKIAWSQVKRPYKSFKIGSAGRSVPPETDQRLSDFRTSRSARNCFSWAYASSHAAGTPEAGKIHAGLNMTHESFAGPIRGNEQVAHDDKVHEHSQLDRPIPSLSPEVQFIAPCLWAVSRDQKKEDPAKASRRFAWCPSKFWPRTRSRSGRQRSDSRFRKRSKTQPGRLGSSGHTRKAPSPNINSLSSTWAWRSRPSTRRAIPRVSGDSGEQPSQSPCRDRSLGQIKWGSSRISTCREAPAPAPAAAAADADGRSNGQLEHGEQESGNPQEWRWPRKRFFNMWRGWMPRASRRSWGICQCEHWSLHAWSRLITSSTAQGGGGSFKNRKPIGEVGCCESGMAERSHWWTERCLMSPLFLSLSLTIYLPIYLLCIYLSISLSRSLSFVYLSSCLPVYLSIYLSVYLSISLSLYLSLSRSLSFVYLSSCLPVYLSIYLSVCLSICLPVYLWSSVIECKVV